MTKKTEIITRRESVVSQDSLTQIESLIHTIRDRQVMLDQDLAALYGVETRRLNEQVRRNIERFPQDFMFQLSPTEFRDMRSQAATATDTDNQTITGMSSQFATTLSRRRPLTALPYAFTENGVAMLSSVLRSPTARNGSPSAAWNGMQRNYWRRCSNQIVHDYDAMGNRQES